MFTTTEYLKFAAISFGYFSLFLSPILYASIVANFPQKLSKRFRFALVCGALSYGTAMLVEAALTPFHMVATYLAPSWDDAGYVTAPQFFAGVAEYSYVLSMIAGVIVAVWLPIHMRKHVWAKIYPPVVSRD